MNNSLPIVQIKDGHAFTTSRDVAEAFDKQHRHVLRDIDNLIRAAPELALSNFGQGYYTLPETGSQQHRHYEMDRDGFALLAMGFTGAKALQWKIRFLQAFNAMEAELRRPIALPRPGDTDRIASVIRSGAPGVSHLAFATDCMNGVLGADRLNTQRMAAAVRSMGWRKVKAVKWNGISRTVYLNPAVEWPASPSERRAAIRSALDGTEPQTVHAVDLLDPAMGMLLVCEEVLLSNRPIDAETATALGSTIEQALKLLTPARNAADH